MPYHQQRKGSMQEARFDPLHSEILLHREQEDMLYRPQIDSTFPYQPAVYP